MLLRMYTCSNPALLTLLLVLTRSFDEADETTFADPTIYRQTDYCIASTTEAFFLNYSFAEVWHARSRFYCMFTCVA